MTAPTVTHKAQKSEHSPQGLDVALLDPLTQSRDALDDVGAAAVLIDAAERVLVQAAAKHTSSQDACDMGLMSHRGNHFVLFGFSLGRNKLCGIDVFGQGTYTTEGIVALMKGIKNSNVQSFR